jgi:hypothetical protein
VRRHRARRTIRRALETDRLSEFHDGLVERSGALPRQPLLEARSEPRTDGGTANVVSLERPPRDHASAVGLERGDGLIERDAGDRRRDVRSHAGKALEIPRASRQLAVELLNDAPGGAMEMTGAGVVSGALPDLEHLIFTRRGEFAHVRKSTHESVEVAGRVSDPGLLEEHFRDPDPIRVSVSPPREGATRAGEPREQISRERRR